VYASKLDESTLRSREWTGGARASNDLPPTVRRQKTVAHSWWRATFAATLAAAVTILGVGSFAQHANAFRTRAGTNGAAVPAAVLERPQAAPAALGSLITPESQSGSPFPTSAEYSTESDPPSLKGTNQLTTLAAPTRGSATFSNPARVGTSLSQGTSKSSEPARVATALPTQPGAVYLSTPHAADVYERGQYLGRAPAEFELSPG